MLSSRGIKTEEEKKKFFNPDYERDLGDPFKMRDMNKAVRRILSAIKKNEKVIIFGDYDADGVCASAILHDFFKKIGFDNFEVCIPDRNNEGYGLNMTAIDEFINKKVNLVITVDCGITDYEEVEKLNEAGIDTVVLDHHLEPDKLPRAAAVVDTKQEKDNYPFKIFVGAGVAFKTVQALIKKGSASRRINIIPGWEKWLLDLVAIATVADMFPLVGENRVLVFYGLQVLKKTQRPGLLSLFKNSGVSQKHATEDDIAFTLAPRINIASRMDHANVSYSLLTTESFEEADWASRHLNELNNERKETVGIIVSEIDRRLAAKKEPLGIIIEGDLSWNTAGLLSLAANRILENYGKTVFLWGKTAAGIIKGSCRSDGSVNLVELMKAMSEGTFLESGGHALASGFSLTEDKIGELEKELPKIYQKIKQPMEENVIWIDKEISLEELDNSFLDNLEKFSPFGIGNPKPVFLLKGLKIFNFKEFGNGGIHLQLDFQKESGKIISAIGFFMTKEKFNLRKEDTIDLLASVERNNFRGSDDLRLRIVDIKKAA